MAQRTFTVLALGESESISGNLDVTGNVTVGGTLAVTGATTLSSTVAVTGLGTFSAGINLGTSQSINSTTSRLEQIGGTTVGTWSAGGLALARTGGDLTASLITATSGKALVTLRGFNSDTTATGIGSAKSGSLLTLTNLDTTDNNYSGIRFLDSDQDTVAGIVGINESHTNNAGSIAIMTRPASGSLTRVVNITSAGDMTLLKTLTTTTTTGLASGTLWNNSGVINIVP